jgi:predicted O-methyltransferase YrrM
MLRIRPHHVFARVPAGQERVTLDLPKQFVGEPLMLEKALLLALLRISRARRIFEFGTFLGGTTAMLARNAPEAEVFTLDLPAGATGSSAVEEDRRLSLGRAPLQALGARVRQLASDSNAFDPAGLGAFDFIWIDGGHDERTVTSDTENAYRMLRPGPTAVIAWHDYGNPKYPELTRYLERVSASRPLMFVEETLMVVDCADVREHVGRA